jgi:hypothetical protein
LSQPQLNKLIESNLTKMENESQLVPNQTPEAEDFDTTLSEDDHASLSPLEIAERKAEFYKELARKKGQARAPEKQLPASKKETDIDARLSAHDQKVELRMEGYSAEEVREIETYAKGRGIGLTEAKASPFVKAAIEAIRKDKQSASVPMEPSSSSVMVGDKSAVDIIRDPASSASDKQKAHEARVQSIMNKRR